MTPSPSASTTRQKLVVGAATVFAEVGYGAAATTAILDAAGSSKGALYFHFDSKDELAAAVIAEQHQRAMVVVDDIMRDTISPLECIVLVSRALADQIVTDIVARAGIRLTFEMGNTAGTVVEPYAEWIRTMATLVERAKVARELVRRVEVDVLARHIVTSFTGLQLVSEVLFAREDLHQRLTEMWELLLPSVVPRRLIPEVPRLARLGLRTDSDRLG